MMISQSYAGSKQLVYLAAVTNWNAVGAAGIKKRGAVRPVYGFDLEPYMNIGNMDIGGETWIPIWLSTYSDNLGSEIYQALNTGFPITKLGQFLTKGQIYTVDMRFAPIIPDGIGTVNDNYAGGVTCPYLPAPITWDAERLIYQMTINIAYPCFVLTTIPEDIATYCVGPIFLNSVSYSVKDGGNVSVAVNAQGVKYASTDGAIYFADTDISPSATAYENVYRSANFIDCYFDMVNNSSLFSSQSFRIISMSLNVKQRFEMQFTCTTIVDDNGARFIELHNRSVTGEVQFLVKDEFVAPMSSEEIVMYFGGPFYFRMRNVKWQNPERSIEVEGSNGGYIHTFSFIALADTESKISFENNFNNPSCSEFYIGK